MIHLAVVVAVAVNLTAQKTMGLVWHPDPTLFGGYPGGLIENG